MGKIRHIAITAEDPFVTAELFKKALGLEEISRGDSDLAREVYLTDGYINLAIVCWKRTKETPNPYPGGYGLDHFGVQVDNLERAEAQARIESALERVNRDWPKTVLVPFTITLGDEWQGLVARVADALAIDFEVRRTLHPLRLATGIGVGTVATPFRERTVQMDGECFHRSRAALERAQQSKESSTRIASGAPLFDDPANALLLLLHAISDRWTDKQHETFVTYRRHGTEVATAAALGVSQPTVHQSLAGAMAKPYAEAYEALLAFAGRVEP